MAAKKGTSKGTVRKKGVSKKQCFVIGPMGGRGSATRKRADKVLNYIIRPALREEYAVERIDEQSPVGKIDDAIVNALCDADLVVADLVGLNPNVMYEMGIRHAWNRPLIPLAKRVTKLPFDVKLFNTVIYEAESPRERLKARQEIQSRLEAIKAGEVQSVTFVNAVGRVGADYSMDPALETLKENLSTLSDFLSSWRTDLEGGAALDKKTLRQMSDVLTGRVALLGELAVLFRTIARRHKGKGAAGRDLEALCAKIRGEIIGGVNKVDKLLTASRGVSQKTISRARTDVDLIIRKAEKIAFECQKKLEHG